MLLAGVCGPRRPAEAIPLYHDGFPELFEVNGPKVDPDNLVAAVSLAALLRHTGEAEASDRLLERGLEVIDGTPAQRAYWEFSFVIQESRIHALRGQLAAALDALPTVRDRGWWHYWWHWLRQDAVLRPLHGESRFQAVRSEIEAEVAAQRARVREWEASGMLSPLPDS